MLSKYDEQHFAWHLWNDGCQTTGQDRYGLPSFESRCGLRLSLSTLCFRPILIVCQACRGLYVPPSDVKSSCFTFWFAEVSLVSGLCSIMFFFLSSFFELPCFFVVRFSRSKGHLCPSGYYKWNTGMLVIYIYIYIYTHIPASYI